MGATEQPEQQEDKRVTLVIADDHPLFLEALVEAISRDPRLNMVAKAVDGRTALDAIREHRPDVAVLDVRMPGYTGPDVAQRIIRDELPTRVLFLSEYREGDLVYSAIESGAAGYLSKTAAPSEICDAVVTVAGGESVISSVVGGELISQIQDRAKSDFPSLSDREHEVLALLVQGFTSREIGDRLHLAVPTVKSHTHNLYAKLGVSHRAAAVAEAMRRGIVD